MSEFKIPLDEPTKDFKIHLSHEGNNRILFSAPFGTGKTYFLKEFFKDSEKYEVIHLYPVNYSVASNEDIFELIKHDVLFELLQKDVDIDNTEFSDLFIAQNFLYENPVDIIKPFIENTSELGKSIVPIFDSLKKLQNKYKLFKKKVNNNDTLNAFQYLKYFQGKKGSNYEQDFFTQLIRNLVLQLNSKGKETVLIIDDLDRIDPEHIFRLLNVFAAHFDHNESENKFGFSKIIFVTDVANLKSIFAAKYGERTDFSGYLNKFFSLNVFAFDNLKNILEEVEKYYRKVLPYTEETREVYRFADYNDTVSSLIIIILKWLIKNNKITLRSLVKLPERKYYFVNSKLNGLEYSMHSIKKSSLYIIPILDFVSYVFGSSKLMEQAFLDCKQEITYEIDIDKAGEKLLMESTLFLMNISNANFLTPNTMETFEFKSLDVLKANYFINNWGSEERIVHSTITKIVNITKGSEEYRKVMIYPFDILYQTLKVLQSEFDLFKN